MKKQRKKNYPLRFSEKKSCVSSYLLQKQKQKITRKSLKTPNYYILLWKPSSSYIFLFSRVMRKYWCINKKKVSSIAVFMQSAMYYKLMPFWTTTKKSLSFPSAKLSFILSTTLHILSQSRHFSLVFCFFHLYYPSTNYAHKKRCILRESTLVKKVTGFYFQPCFFLTKIL